MERLCKCGCGQPAPKVVYSGRNKGYRKYVKGHQPPRPLCDPIIRAKAHLAHAQRLPIGSRRIKEVYGNQYWEVKVPGRRRWQLEHRLIMEQRLGRPLERREHVHHRDDNGLNNGLHADGQDNLVLLSISAHSSLTNKAAPYERCQCKCPHCGANLKHIKRSGKTRRQRGQARLGLLA
jgi:hypothetical protein